MTRIFITGDTHGDVTRLNTESFFEQKEMTKDDYLIRLLFVVYLFYTIPVTMYIS